MKFRPVGEVRTGLAVGPVSRADRLPAKTAGLINGTSTAVASQTGPARTVRTKDMGQLKQSVEVEESSGPPARTLNTRRELQDLTFAWNPASFRALMTASASNSPVTSNVAAFAFTVSPFTPSTFFSAALMPLVHCPQQLWTSVTVRL